MDDADNDDEDCDCCFCRGDLPQDLIDEVLKAASSPVRSWTVEEYLALLANP